MTYFTDLDPITSDEDIIDSRTVIARVEYLQALADDDDADMIDDDEREELAQLRELADDGETNVADWHYGAALVRFDYFETYAKQWAEDIGAFDPNAATWPHNHIDWQAAADELHEAYVEVMFGDVTYYARS